MLLGCSFGQWLEPMGDMSYPMFHRPLFHAFSNLIGNVTVKSLVAFYACYKGFVCRRLEVFAHLVTVEHQFPEIF